MKQKNIRGRYLSILLTSLILLPSLVQTSIASSNIETPIFELNEDQMDNINAGYASAAADALAIASSIKALTISNVDTLAGSNKYINYAAAFAVAVACCDNQTTEATANTFVTGETINTFSGNQNTDYSSTAWSVSIGY